MASLRVRVQPRSSNPGIGVKRGGTLVVRLASAPADGEGNDELIKLLAKTAGIAKGKVTITKGQKSRDKVLEFEGISEDALSDALEWDA
jgi:uncharacterized protein (TIGR00251 family)